MSVVSIDGAFEINQEELSEFVRSEIDSSDFGSMMTDAASEAMSDWDLDQMQYELNELDSVTDRHDDRLDAIEKDLGKVADNVSRLADHDRTELREIIGQEIDGFDLSGFKTSPEVDAALRKQHQRIEELEHAVLCLFEYLFDDTQRVLARGHERFNDSLQGGE
tara:strand:+ start:337 stop:828 length:492 start_codon:yes stop_codon:yes gene_type:complete